MTLHDRGKPGQKQCPFCGTELFASDLPDHLTECDGAFGGLN